MEKVYNSEAMEYVNLSDSAFFLICLILKMMQRKAEFLVCVKIISNIFQIYFRESFQHNS